jgi:hypothetical protein
LRTRLFTRAGHVAKLAPRRQASIGARHPIGFELLLLQRAMELDLLVQILLEFVLAHPVT